MASATQSTQMFATQELTEIEKMDIAMEAVDKIWRSKGYDEAMPIIYDFIQHMWEQHKEAEANADLLQDWYVSFEILAIDQDPSYVTLGEANHDTVKAGSAKQAIEIGLDRLALVVEPHMKVICRGAWPAAYLDHAQTT